VLLLLLLLLPLPLPLLPLLLLPLLKGQMVRPYHCQCTWLAADDVPRIGVTG
jgi:hypothetical protein